MTKREPLSQGPDWNFELLDRYDQAIKEIAVDEFGLDCYPNQIEIIASEQMLDAYASVGMPISYPHWSFGKQFIIQEEQYRKGAQGLAYEIVINSDPCISYLMEENSMPLQGLVIAHACYGHNSFFKGNYLFRQWTSADSIVDYLVFAKNYVRRCEERYGVEAVEDMFDACHALRDFGVSRYHRPPQLSIAEELARQRERDEYEWQRHDEIWSTVPKASTKGKGPKAAGSVEESQENLLYFLEKCSPKLAGWQREIIRIVRKMGQYFYPQGQTKVMNEGWATFWHYTILNRMYDKGLVDDGFMIEVLASHSNVIAQRGFDERGYGGFNPYALGFAMFMDIKRICEDPTDEDRHWFPDIAGTPWLPVLDFAMRNYKDESFIRQYLSPRLIRHFHLFALSDHEGKEYLEVDSIHNEAGYRRVRQLLSDQYNRDGQLPDLQITGFDQDGDRTLTVQHRMHRNRPLSGDADVVLNHLRRLWGFDVRLESVNQDGEVLAEQMYEAS
ncbi:SpoVR family protein [Granulosicoccus antarcticus]|uniref:SpoVR family protein n=1 Tax=Granulosicoccus antarcticus IMCC3135 TaxID=1192854 RepID=A0A2Z2NLK0_9GAMM|nr:SpoVR family protein [Granulosicoccus antarcticus]ASJ70851.1 hypothetical protein IMCC3135_03690 [Granulosicoccus antarcticus IMCC3135]